MLVETPFKLSPTSMVISVLFVRFFAPSISVIIVNLCFLLKYLWRLLLAGMHPVDRHADRMSKHVEYIDKCDFSSLRFPVPQQFIYQCIWYREQQESDLSTSGFTNS